MFILNRIILFLNWLAIGSLGLAYLATWINPQSFILPSFFGLAFPFIFFANILCLVWWFFFGKFRMIYSGIALVIGFSYWNRSFNLVGSDSTGEDVKEKSVVLTYNVRLFDLYNWTNHQETKQKIFNLLIREDADIYCFQEFFHQGEPTNFETRDTLIKILKTKNYAEAYTHKLRLRQFFGLAVFTHYPILKSGSIDFANDPNNNALWVDIKRKTDTVRVYNVHLSSIRFQYQEYKALGEELGPGIKERPDIEQKVVSKMTEAYKKRVDQVNEVMDHVKKSPYKVILCGDFNDTPVSYTYSQVSAELVDAFAATGSGFGSTYTGKFPFLRIDYIWHSPELKSTACKVIREKLSDHYPVRTEVYSTN